MEKRAEVCTLAFLEEQPLRWATKDIADFRSRHVG